MKKLFSLFLALAASMGTIFASNMVDGIWYIFDNGKAEVTHPYPSSYRYLGSIIIPSTVIYNNITYHVTSIGSGAFFDCSSLTSITIPNSVTSIGSNAFNGCTGLTSITIPNGVIRIEAGVFENCTGLTKFTIPNSVTSIGGGAFSDCSGLTNITIPNGVTSIGDFAFAGCSNLTSITIPNSVTNIGEGAFLDCSSLTDINVETDNPNYCSVDGVLFDKYERELIQYPGGKSGSYTIPNSALDIRKYAFALCSGLTSITIPNSVYLIRDFAFAGCSGLTTITIPNSVIDIGLEVFAACSGLTSIVIEDGNSFYDSRNNCNAIIQTATNTLVAGCMNTTIPNSVTEIGGYAFDGCTGLTTITIPNSVIDIGEYAFAGCSGLTSITFPNSVLGIRTFTFAGCSGLTSVTFPGSFLCIEGGAFAECSGLTSITCEAVTPPTCGEYPVFYNVDKSIPLYVPAESTEAYKEAYQWSDFTHIYPIEYADEINDTNVSATPNEDNSVTLTWPIVENAVIYTIEIKKNGELVCTLEFDEYGKLISKVFAMPARKEERHNILTATQTIGGWQYVVEGLDEGTEYTYIVTAKKDDESVLFTESIAFTTMSHEAIDEVTTDNVKTSKLLRNGQILIQKGDKTFDLRGQEVK